MIRWIEISADYRCNCRCVGCFSSGGGEGQQMSTEEILDVLRMGRAEGAENLWLGGGEPTLRKDLLSVIRMARESGYRTIKLQTNGMMLAYPDFTRRVVSAGITEVNFSIKGATRETHEALTRTPGSHELLLRGIDAARGHGLPLEGDILAYWRNTDEIPGMVRTYHARGIGKFSVWIFCAAEQEGSELVKHVPRISDVVARVVEALDLGLSEREDFIVSLHTPACTVPRTHWRCLFHAASLDLVVANPGGYRFRLEESPIEGGVYLDGCSACAMREKCGGLRRDYLEIHGDGEFQPVKG